MFGLFITSQPVFLIFISQFSSVTLTKTEGLVYISIQDSLCLSLPELYFFQGLKNRIPKEHPKTSLSCEIMQD